MVSAKNIIAVFALVIQLLACVTNPGSKETPIKHNVDDFSLGLKSHAQTLWTARNILWRPSPGEHSSLSGVTGAINRLDVANQALDQAITFIDSSEGREELHNTIHAAIDMALPTIQRLSFVERQKPKIATTEQKKQFIESATSVLALIDELVLLGERPDMNILSTWAKRFLTTSIQLKEALKPYKRNLSL